jgi:hypothetical protein
MGRLRYVKRIENPAVSNKCRQTPKLRSKMSSGKIVQIIGAVVDVEFPRGEVPNVYDALTVDDKDHAGSPAAAR